MPKKNITKKEKKIVDDLWEYTKQANMKSDAWDLSLKPQEAQVHLLAGTLPPSFRLNVQLQCAFRVSSECLQRPEQLGGAVKAIFRAHKLL